MAAFIAFLIVYVVACAWFFFALVRWSVRSERQCACGGALGSAKLEMLHGTKVCYPAREAVRFG
jgi:hypothetical protein